MYNIWDGNGITGPVLTLGRLRNLSANLKLESVSASFVPSVSTPADWYVRMSVCSVAISMPREYPCPPNPNQLLCLYFPYWVFQCQKSMLGPTSSQNKINSVFGLQSSPKLFWGHFQWTQVPKLKTLRIALWTERIPNLPRKFSMSISASEYLPPGADYKWMECNCLNRLRTGTGRCKETLTNLAITQRCDCGNKTQYMAHLLRRPLLEQKCKVKDLAVHNDVAKTCVQQQHWLNNSM